MKQGQVFLFFLAAHDPQNSQKTLKDIDGVHV
jgi:hypothetical protein